ncbi:hypothetical protein [Cellulomonas sp. SLBN-39]|uniref:hypothetical protein n=1 Tax=Cellulomonas sp. SLBN-39 TaxID=2768446 RepID=UPI001151EA9E|nr:hypothetical protein [Cellulomonas sp. SLBN-39]TQL04628.1 hypothetical protein FBY24_3749 [Cellulomonas sp. SLBN-39]
MTRTDRPAPTGHATTTTPPTQDGPRPQPDDQQPFDPWALDVPTDAELDALHRRNRLWGLAVLVLPASAVAVLGWRVLADGEVGSIGVVAAVIGVLVAVVMVRMAASTRARHRAVRAVRPGAEVVEVWGAAGLRDVLVELGVPAPPLRPAQGTALTLVVAPTGVELWAGAGSPAVLWSAPWADVPRVLEGSGVIAGNGARPAVLLVLPAGYAVVLVPARRVGGSFLPAPVARTRALVRHLEQVRAAASGVGG